VTASPVAAPAPTVLDARRLTFRGEGSIVVRGPVTGLAYVFAGPDDALDVDGRDVAGLTELGRFETR
jgi:hypothetical protein